MTDKFLFRAGIAAFTILILAVGAVAVTSHSTPTVTEEGLLPPATAITTASQRQVSGVASRSGTESAPVQSLGSSSLGQTAASTFSSTAPGVESDSSNLLLAQTTPREVRVSDLEKLAMAVHFGGSNVEGMNKELWAQQIPVAQKLLDGVCDCEQRNWLNRFIMTGNFALAGSDEYYQSLQILTTLPKSDVGTPVN